MENSTHCYSSPQAVESISLEKKLPPAHTFFFIFPLTLGAGRCNHMGVIARLPVIVPLEVDEMRRLTVQVKDLQLRPWGVPLSLPLPFWLEPLLFCWAGPPPLALTSIFQEATLLFSQYTSIHSRLSRNFFKSLDH